MAATRTPQGKPQEEIQEVRRLVQEGMTLRQAAAQFGWSHTTVSVYVRDIIAKKHPYKGRKSETVEGARAIQHTRQNGTRRSGKCSDCGKPIYPKSTRCSDCQKLIRQSKKDAKQQRREAAGTGEVRFCRKSPSGAHWWIFSDQYNGQCKYCRNKRHIEPFIPGYIPSDLKK